MSAPPTEATAGERWRAFATLFSLGMKADPLRTAVVIFPLLPLAGMVYTLAFRTLVNAVVANDRTGIVIAVAIFVGIFPINVVLGFSQLRIRMRLSESVGFELDQRLMRYAANIPDIEHFERPELLNRLEVVRTERAALQDAMSGLGRTIESAAFVAVGAVLLSIVDPLLALFAIGGSLPTAIVTSSTTKAIEKVVASEAERNRRALHLFDVATTPGPAKEIRVFGMRDELLDRYSREWRDYDRAIVRAELRAAAVRTGALFITVAGYTAALLWLVRLIRRGEVSAGDAFMVIGVASRLAETVGRSQFGVGMFRKARSVAERYVGFVDYGDKRLAQSYATRELPRALTRGIELDDVSYRYVGADAPAIEHLTMHLPPGAVVAVVGENGAGKSTLVKLLLGLYRPASGTIHVDGVDLATVNPEVWRLHTSACFQDFAKLELVAREVVGVGDLPRVDDLPAVERAVERAGARDVIDGLGAGYETQLGRTFDGLELSGGQAQKLALGRSMMRDAPLLLALDEPTSALDPLAEFALFEGYAQAARTIGAQSGGITVLVSHRFSTVRMADLIVVMDKGRVAEHGTHADLMACNGLYAELYTLQAAQYGTA